MSFPAWLADWAVRLRWRQVAASESKAPPIPAFPRKRRKESSHDTSLPHKRRQESSPNTAFPHNGGRNLPANTGFPRKRRKKSSREHLPPLRDSAGEGRGGGDVGS